MRSLKRWACLILAALVLMCAAFAEEGGSQAEVDPPAEVQTDPTPTPSPTPEAPAEPTPTPTPEPAEEPTPEPTVEPTLEPSPEPTAEPTPEPVEEPTAEPTVEPTPEPTPEPAPTIVIRVSSPEGLAVSGGACAVDVTQAQSLTLSWDCGAACDGYALSLIGPDGAELLGGRQSEASVTLTLEGRAAGRYTLTVTALLGENAVASAQVAIDLTQSGQPEGGMPQGGGGHGGGKSGGSGGKSQGGSEAAEQEQGFHVTPGTALTGNHASGTKEMRLYGALELTAPEEAMTTLTLGGEALDIALEDGTPFTAVVDGDTLILTAEVGEAWQLNGLALKRLAGSGIETIILNTGEWQAELAAGEALRGDIYARLRGEGVTSSGFDYVVSGEGVLVTVNGETYRLDDENALIPMEGD